MLITPSMVQQQGSMVQITIPNKIEKQFRSSIFKEEGFVCLFTNLNAIDIKKRHPHTTIKMLRFQETSRVQRLNSRGDNIPKFAFNFCPFQMMLSKDIPLKPLIGTTKSYFVLHLFPLICYAIKQCTT
jgi:hypothetical protein